MEKFYYGLILSQAFSREETFGHQVALAVFFVNYLTNLFYIPEPLNPPLLVRAFQSGGTRPRGRIQASLLCWEVIG